MERILVSILTRPEGRVQLAYIVVQPHGQDLFQSSPVPKDGCNSCASGWRHSTRSSFNPHPSRRTGATWELLHFYRRTRCFNPHPSRRTGATDSCADALRPCRFNPHPSRRTGATPPPAPNATPCLCFNPHPSRRTGATFCQIALLIALCVSILTRPEGRVQLSSGRNNTQLIGVFQSSPVPKDGCNRSSAISGIPCHSVSILTRPEGRVQRTLRFGCPTKSMFQSSPVPKDGCNLLHLPQSLIHELVSILTRPEGRVQLIPTSRFAFSGQPCFNPHPSRRTGATDGPADHVVPFAVSILTRPEGRVQRRVSSCDRLSRQFQSSPVPKDGCNGSLEAVCRTANEVSILTRPEGRVQRQSGSCLQNGKRSFNPHPSRRTGATDGRVTEDMALVVSILTRPEGRVQPGDQIPQSSPQQGFNPHPSRRTGATIAHKASSTTSVRFQSSPVPKDGCNSGFCPRSHISQVSILTRPEGRVQRQK